MNKVRYAQYDVPYNKVVSLCYIHITLQVSTGKADLPTYLHKQHCDECRTVVVINLVLHKIYDTTNSQ